MFTRLRQYRYHGLVTAILLGIAGTVIVLLLPARQVATARVQMVAEQTVAEQTPLRNGAVKSDSIISAGISLADALALLDNDAVLARLLQRVEPETGDKIDPRPVDPLVAFRRYFAIASVDDQGVFDVSYAGRSGETANQVVHNWLELAGDSLARRNALIDAQSLPDDKARADRAEPTVRNRDAERIALQAKVDEARVALAAWDASDTEAAKVRQDGLQKRVGDLGRELDAAIAQTGSIEARLAATPPSITQRVERPAPASAPTARGRLDPALQARVREAEARLEALRVSFTDNHPDVRRQMAVIADLRAERDNSATTRPAAAAPPPVLSEREVANPAWQSLDRELKRGRRTLETLRTDLAKARADVSDAATDSTQAVAASSGASSSDENTPRSALVTTLATAEAVLANALADASDLSPAATPGADVASTGSVASESGEAASAIGSRASGKMTRVSLRVVEPAMVRPAASNPDRPMWLQRVLFASLALGALTALVLSMRRTTYHDSRALERSTGLRALGEIPRFASFGLRLRRWLQWLVFLLLVALYVVAFLLMIRLLVDAVAWSDITPNRLYAELLALYDSARELLRGLIGGLRHSGEAR